MHNILNLLLCFVIFKYGESTVYQMIANGYYVGSSNSVVKNAYAYVYSLEQCKNICDNTVDCIAIDYTPRSATAGYNCYFHYNFF